MNVMILSLRNQPKEWNCTSSDIIPPWTDHNTGNYVPSLWDQCVGCFTSPSSLTRGGERDMITWTAEANVEHTTSMMLSVTSTLIINPVWGMSPGMVTLLCDFTAAGSKRSHYLHFALRGTSQPTCNCLQVRLTRHSIQTCLYTVEVVFLSTYNTAFNKRLSFCLSACLSVPLSLFQSIFTPSQAF